jgi:transcriptional regulator with XRE-family HTH domain
MASLEKQCAAWIRRQLKGRGLTQEAAARELGTSLATISRWATGRALPSYRELIRLKEAWGALPPPLG